jgi:hypothetical protein
MLWSVKSIMQNRDNLCGSLKTTYAYPALVPPMPWINRTPPSTPRASGTASGNNTVITWQKTDNNTAKIAVQSRIGNTWTTIKIIGVSNAGATIPLADAIAISAVDRYGNTSTPNILRK